MMVRSVASRRTWIPFLVLVPVLAFHVSGAVRPAAAQAVKPWEFDQYRQFEPSAAPAGSEVTTRAIAPTLKLSRVAVQRPQVAPGETASLIAEYDVSVPQDMIEIKETRVIRFEGQKVATLEKVVSLKRGRTGSTVALKVPSDAAPGLYTITTSIERVVSTRGESGAAAAGDRGQSVFRVELRAATPASPPAVASDARARLQLWADQPQRKIGETLKVFFKADRDGYATLVNVGTSGKITILFPNAYMPNHAVKAGQTYSVPGPDDPYELTLSGPEGVELVYALFTIAPTRFAEENLIKSSAFAPVNDQAETITRDINLTVKKIPLKEQATAVLEIEVTR
jgi:hypothetical protein